jgi:hypothetical protein
MFDYGPERRSGEVRRQKDRRYHERRKVQRRARAVEKPLFELVPGRRKKSDRRSGVDRRQRQRRQWARRDSDVKALETKLELKEGVYYVREQIDGLSEGPYCTRCFDLQCKLMPLERNIDLSRKLATYVCPHCGAIY